MTSPDVLMELATELIENIAFRLSPEDLLSLRRAHPQLAKRSFNPFAEYFLSQIT